MERLTKKFNGEYYRKDANTIMFNSEVDYSAIQKLGKLEDLEQELGCPLEVVIQKIKELMEENKNKTNYNCCLEYDSFRKLWYIQDYRYYYGSYDVDNPELYLKDYQKTWWLKGEKDE